MQGDNEKLHNIGRRTLLFFPLSPLLKGKMILLEIILSPDACQIYSAAVGERLEH